MTVKELIAELQALSADEQELPAYIYTEGEGGYECDWREVEGSEVGRLRYAQPSIKCVKIE